MQQSGLAQQAADADEDFWERERTQLPGTLTLGSALTDPERQVTGLCLSPRCAAAETTTSLSTELRQLSNTRHVCGRTACSHSLPGCCTLLQQPQPWRPALRVYVHQYTVRLQSCPAQRASTFSSPEP